MNKKPDLLSVVTVPDGDVVYISGATSEVPEVTKEEDVAEDESKPKEESKTEEDKAEDSESKEDNGEEKK